MSIDEPILADAPVVEMAVAGLMMRLDARRELVGDSSALYRVFENGGRYSAWPTPLGQLPDTMPYRDLLWYIAHVDTCSQRVFNDVYPHRCVGHIVLTQTWTHPTDEEWAGFSRWCAQGAVGDFPVGLGDVGVCVAVLQGRPLVLQSVGGRKQFQRPFDDRTVTGAVVDSLTRLEKIVAVRSNDGTRGRVGTRVGRTPR